MTLAALALLLIYWLVSVDMAASFERVAEAATPYGDAMALLRREGQIGAEVRESLPDTALSDSDRLALHYRARVHANTLTALLRAGDAILPDRPGNRTDDAGQDELRTRWLETKTAINRWAAGVEQALTLYRRWESTAILAPDAFTARLLRFRSDIYQDVAGLNALVFGGADTGVDPSAIGREGDLDLWLDEFPGGSGSGVGNAAVHRIADTVAVPYREFRRGARDLAQQIQAGHGDAAARRQALGRVVDASQTVVRHLGALSAEAKRAKSLYETARRYSTTDLARYHADAARSLDNLAAALQADLENAASAHAGLASRRNALCRWLTAAAILLAVGLAASLGWAVFTRHAGTPAAGTGPLSRKSVLLTETAGRFLAESSRLLRSEAPGPETATGDPTPPLAGTDAARTGPVNRIAAADANTAASRIPHKFHQRRRRPRPPIRHGHGKWT